MTNRDVANKFFEDRNGRFERGSMSVSYSDNIYYSYSTAIGKIVKDINGNNVLIVSNDCFSMTTTKHIHELIEAGCKHGLKIYYLPQEMYRGDFYLSWIVDIIKGNLEFFSKEKLTRKNNREGVEGHYSMLINLLMLEDFKPYFKEIKKILKKYESVYEYVKNYKK